MNLILAAKNGDLEALRSQIESGKCINHANAHGWTPLHMSVFYNNFDCFEYILSLEDTRLEAKTHSGETALYVACFNVKVSAKYVKRLIEAGADVNTEQNESKTPLYQIADNASSSMTEEEVIENIKKAYLLIEANAYLNACEDLGDDTPLFAAIYHNNYELVEILLYAGADANLKRDFDGCTPLMLASQRGSIEIVTMLLPFIDDINQVDYDGRTALMSAPKDVAQLLLEAGANPNIIATDLPITALHLAIESYDFQKCKLLLPLITTELINDTIDYNLVQFFRSRLSNMSKEIRFTIECFKAILYKDIDEEFFFVSYFNGFPYPPISVLLFPFISSLDEHLWEEYLKLIYIFLSKGTHLNSIEPERPLHEKIISKFKSWSPRLESLMNIFIDHGLNIDLSNASFNFLLRNANRDEYNSHLLFFLAQYMLHLDEFDFKSLQSSTCFQCLDERTASACAFTFAEDNLKSICRKVIRRTVLKNSRNSREFIENIISLPIPRIMVNYIRYKFT